MKLRHHGCFKTALIETTYTCISAIIRTDNRGILAICKLIVTANQIGIDETVDTRIVVPASEIIQPRLFVVDIATVTERIDLTQRACHGAGAADGASPRIVLILYHGSALVVKNGNNIALKVMHIGILGPVELNDGRPVAGVVEEVQTREQASRQMPDGRWEWLALFR